MIRICNSLAKYGYQVKLIGRVKTGSITLTPTVYQQKRLRCYFQSGKAFYIEYNIRLFFYLLSQPFDAICAVDLDTILPALLVSKIKGKVCIYDAHEYFTETPEVVRRPVIQWVWKKIAWFTIPKLKYCYTVGSALAKIFSDQYGTNFAVIRNVPQTSSNISDKAQETPKNKEPFVILYQGALNEGRGLEQMIEALPFLPTVRLWLIGEGDLSKYLRSIVSAKNLENQVLFFGYVRPEELRKITPKADAGINLLENKGQSYYFSLANKAFDFVQAGIPAINMNFPEYNRLNQEYEVAILIDDLQSETIISAVERLIEDKAYYFQLYQNCLEARKEWNWEKEEQILLDLYRNWVI